MKSKGFFAVTLLVVGAVMLRLLPHPPNFTPLLSVALFGGAIYARKYLAVIIPLFAFWFSDLVLNNTIYAQYNEGIVWFAEYQLYTFIPMVLISLMAIGVFKKINWLNVLGGSVAASVIFFIVSNFGTWMSGMLYPKTIVGLGACYAAAIPFFHNTLISTVLFSSIIFMVYSLYAKWDTTAILDKKSNNLLFWQ